MARQAKTLFGIISNLKDMWTNFLLLVAEAGIFDMVKKDLEGLLSRVNEMAKSGELKKWAEDISDRLQKAWEWGKKFVDETKWDKVGQEVKRIADAVGVLADAILWLKDASAWLNTGSAADDFVYSIPDRIRNMRGSLVPAPPPPAPGSPASRLPSDNDFVRKLSGKQAGLNIGGALKIDVSSSPDLKVRATPVNSLGTPLPMEVRTGKTMRSAS